MLARVFRTYRRCENKLKDFPQPEWTKSHTPHTFTPAQIAKAQSYFTGPLQIRQIFDPAQLAGDSTEGDLPEVCMVGKSNVGKSSLINTLLNSSVAVVSKTPGRTQAINILKVRNTFHLVDMPGYGFASVSKVEKARLTGLIKEYIIQRDPTVSRLICVLIDSRRGLSPPDKQLMEFLDDSHRPYLLVLTKIDKVKKTELGVLIAELENTVSSHSCCYPEIVTTSSQNKIGFERLRTFIATACDIVRTAEGEKE